MIANLGGRTWASIVVLLVVTGVMLAKNQNVYKNHNIILCAIERWRDENPYELSEEVLDMIWSMEDYGCTLFRLTDWGYANILPRHKYEKIRPFIKRV